MRRYEQYILSHLFWPTLVVSLSLTGIVWLTQVLRFLDFVLNRGLSFFDFLMLTGLLLPSLLLIILPVAFAISVLYAFVRLISESEAIIFHAVGISPWQLTRPVMLLGAAVMVICYALSFYIMPLANGHFRDIRLLFRDKYASVLLEEEVFNNPIEGVTVFVRERVGQNQFKGLLIHDNRVPREPITLTAEDGTVEQTQSGPRFLLQHGLREQEKAGRISWLSFDAYTLDLAFYGQDGSRRRSPDERTIGELLLGDASDDKQRRANLAEAAQRVSWPLLSLGLPLVVLAVLFRSEFNRRGQWRRIMLGSAGMVVTIVLLFALRSMALQHAALAAAMIALVVCLMSAMTVLIVYAGQQLRRPTLSRRTGG